jgi:hypothetical protein
MSDSTKKKTAQELFKEAFFGPRDKRSEEYRNGVLSALKFRLGEKKYIRGGYGLGTAQNDAFSAGCEEGHAIARKYLSVCKEK